MFLSASVAIFLSAFVFVVWHVVRIDALTIAHVSVRGAESLEEEDVRSKVDETMLGTYWGIIPKKFLYLYPKEKILSSLTSIDRVSTAAMHTEQNALMVSVTEYKPSALWCKNTEEKVTSECFYSDSTGYSYEQAPQLIGGTMPRFYIKGSEPKKDEQMLTRELFERLISLSTSLALSFGLQVQYFTIEEANDVILTLGSGAEIRINTLDSIEQIFTNISSILNAKEFENLKTGKFEYIDLRFGNKVFVEKEPLLDIASSTSESSESE